MKKRVFIGSFINIPSFKKHYTQIKKDFGGIISGRWIHERNFHITFRFIGEIETEKLCLIKQSLNPVLNKKISTEINFTGLGAFPDITRPRVFFINVVDKEGVLNEIYTSINSKLNNLGFKNELKPFKPHITLKRIKGYNSSKFAEKINRYRDISFGSQQEIEINIIESILTPKGAYYKKLE
ncbi:RNA 2',3'-cyclic phosphodiesterase [Persephonella atlantica]|uniref:RNA 2',3'-cyclic phosphodiesterase n=1 Tax=Persephonella atlantica TaxID=2699429 RepID=UPI001F5BD074|nr:RNA 2',3'-cyclic phosphodiesterase [Persephonella atlantica]